MAEISTYLENIKTAIYGEEVRGSIHDAIKAMNEESSNAIKYASTAKDSAQASAASAAQNATAAAAAGQTAQAAAADAKASKNAVEQAKNSAEAAKQAAQAAAADAKASENAVEQAKNSTEAAKQAAQSAANDASTSAGDAAQAAASAQEYSGKPPKPQDGTWWIWDAAQKEYINSGIGCELEGPAGNGIQDIQLTSGDHAPGTTDIYTVTMTDGSTTPISVYNGRNGMGAGDVLGISFDLVLPASGWVNGELTVADSRLMALPTNKYFVDADEASRDEYLKCNVQAKDITATGFITFKNDTDPTVDLTVNIIRLELSVNGS